MTLDEVFGTSSVKTDLQSHNMTVRLASAPLDTGNAEKRLSKRGITIRRAPSDDADWLRDELVGIWKPSWLAEVDAAVRGVHSQLFFAVQESRCVGFCAYGINRPHEVGPLGTHPSLRRMGIGSVLIKRCLDEQSREGSGCGRPSAASTGSAPVNAYIRTTAPSLVRPATTTPPPAVSPIGAGQREQDRAQPSSGKPRRADRAPICAPILGSSGPGRRARPGAEGAVGLVGCGMSGQATGQDPDTSCARVSRSFAGLRYMAGDLRIYPEVI